LLRIKINKERCLGKVNRKQSGKTQWRGWGRWVS
jgi:hypothetical protein